MSIISHLTIDLDYWMHHKDFRTMKTFLKKVVALNTSPIKLVKYHHHVLPLAYGSQINTILNVDFHSDIGDISHRYLSKKEFNEGTWVNYANLRKRNNYMWFYPHKKCPTSKHGFCHAYDNPFLSTEPNRDYGWKSISKHHGLPPESLLSTVKSVSICFSPNWMNFRQCVKAFLILKKLGIMIDDQIELCVNDHEKDIKQVDKQIIKKLGIK